MTAKKSDDEKPKRKATKDGANKKILAGKKPKDKNPVKTAPVATKRPTARQRADIQDVLVPLGLQGNLVHLDLVQERSGLLKAGIGLMGDKVATIEMTLRDAQIALRAINSKYHRINSLRHVPQIFKEHITPEVMEKLSALTNMNTIRTASRAGSLKRGETRLSHQALPSGTIPKINKF